MVVARVLISLLLSAAVPAAAQPAPDPALRAALQSAIADSHSFEDRFDAEVWLLDMSNRLAARMADDAERLRFLRLVHAEATRAELTPEVVLAVIEIESGFDRFAVSVAGAQGLMQVMPFWIDELRMPDGNLFDPHLNLRMGCTILKYYLDQERGDLRKALARYNGSAGKRKYPDKVLLALAERWYRR